MTSYFFRPLLMVLILGAAAVSGYAVWAGDVPAPLPVETPAPIEKPADKADKKADKKAAPEKSQKEMEEETYRELNLFGEVFERARAQYVDKVTDKELIENAINGMLSSLDPHSSYLNEDGLKDMTEQTRGEFGGLGIEVTQEDGFVKVVTPIDDTPAARAGMQPGDFITHLDGKPLIGLTLSEAVDMLRGKVGSEITLTVRRDGEPEPMKMTLRRDIIKIQSVKNRIEGDIGYIRITSFNDNTETGLIKAIEESKKKLGDQLNGFVIDLRNNPGGLLEQAIAVSDTFLEKGEIVSTRGRSDKDTRRDNATEGDSANGLPIVVITNGGTASAAEIVAGALQDHRRAIIVGTPSFGKGSVQTVMPIAGHGAMKLTTARYYTPSGRSIQAKGIEPDILIEQAKLEPIHEEDRIKESDLKGALANPDGKEDRKIGKKEKNGKEDKKSKEEEVIKNDYQLQRALDLIRGLSLYTRDSETPIEKMIATKGQDKPKSEATNRIQEKSTPDDPLQPDEQD